MVLIQGGTFTMGCTIEQRNNCNSDENPSHQVTLSPFYIGKYEVTQRLWMQIMNYNPSRFIGDDLPVENISWEEIQDFLRLLNEETGKSFRLPTEAEWEYVARLGNQENKLDLEVDAWYVSNSDNTTHAVGTKRPNELGIFDLIGNVWEWCSDHYGVYSQNDQTNPAGVSKGNTRVVRGGCFAALPRQCRVSARKSYYSGGKDFSIGFRLAMNDDSEARAAAEKQAEQERLAAKKAEEAAAEAAAKEAEKEEAAKAKQIEQERIAAEKEEAAKAKQIEQERIAAEKEAAAKAKQIEQERIAAEKEAAAKAKQAEQERIAAEKEAAAKAKQIEQERIAAEKEAAAKAKQAEQERIAAEKEAAAKAKQAEQERIAAEKAEMRQLAAKHRHDSISNLPWNTFFTLNAACSGIPQFSYGFKIGQVKFVGWFFSAMSNFNFKGAFTPFTDSRYVLTGVQKTTKLSASIGLVIRPCKPLSLHLGTGLGYRSLNIETESGWYQFPKRTFFGVDAVAGLMFHIKCMALSVEAVYTTIDFNHSNLDWKSRLEGKIGIGFMLPHKKHKK